ncbi:MAG: four helix bundle protein [Gemmatimonadaceae bacterium]
MSDFRQLEVWRVSHALVLNIHSAVKQIRGSDYLSLKSQMLRAAMSIPTNLVEGVGQKTAREFAKFIRISLNSANELEYHLQLAHDFGVMEREEFSTLLNQTVRVRKMLHGLLRSIAPDPPDGAQKSSHRSSRGTGNGATGNPQRVTSESAATPQPVESSASA